jgi:hypothetical protein
MTNEDEDFEIQGIEGALGDAQELAAEIEDNEGFNPIFIELNTGMQLRVYCDQTFDAILTTNNHQHPTVFQKDGRLVRIIKKSNGSRTIQEIHYEELFNAITYRVNYFKTPTQKQQMEYMTAHMGQQMDNIPISPPKEIVTNILSRSDLRGIPELVGIVTCPIIDLTTGGIRTDSHYDSTSQMYYGNMGLVIPPIPETPTKEQVDAAIHTIKETIIDFPFVDEVSRTNTIAMIITTVIRPSIVGNIPIFLIDKPAPGTGAGLLCDSVAIIVTGGLARVTTLTKGGEEEWKKVIVSVLRSGDLLSIVDNIEDKVNLPSLASVVTCGLYSDRLLRTNDMFTAPHRQTWILNGNNVELGGDIARRVVGIRMNANLEQPWLRKENCFSHNQIPYITQTRGEILAAIYTIVRSWVQAGSHIADDKIPPMGSFEAWRNIMGGIMQHIGCGNFLSNAQEMIAETDVDSPQWNTFIETLFDKLVLWNKEDKCKKYKGKFDETPDPTTVSFTTKDVLDIMRYEENPNNVLPNEQRLRDTLPEGLADEYLGQRSFNHIFGNAIRKHKDRIFKNIKLEKSENTEKRAVIWNLINNINL